MNRPIEFRAYDKESQKMFYFDIFEYANDQDCEYGEADFPNEHQFLISKEAVLMQFTGLTDKNGKKIFEGDILKDGPHSDPGYVYFRNARFCWSQGPEWGEIDPDVEIIGNIFENPELLEDELTKAEIDQVFKENFEDIIA